jgi:hypothetical protein
MRPKPDVRLGYDPTLQTSSGDQLVVLESPDLGCGDSSASDSQATELSAVEDVPRISTTVRC